MHLSVVIPVYNSAATIKTVVADCFTALGHIDFELVLVDDGSVDGSHIAIFNLAETHPNIKAISLAKNVGEFNAVMCGLNYASGDYVAIIDDDGQNPPAEILKLLAEAEKGFDVVYARYSEKKHSWWRNAGSWFSNFTATMFTKKPYGLYLSSFKVIKKELVQKIIAYKKPNVYPDALITKYAVNIGYTEAIHKNAEVKSRYTLRKLTDVYSAMLITQFGVLGYLLFYIIVFLFLLIVGGALTYGYWLVFKEMFSMMIQWLFVGLGILTAFIMPKRNKEPQFIIKKASFNA